MSSTKLLNDRDQLHLSIASTSMHQSTYHSNVPTPLHPDIPGSVNPTPASVSILKFDKSSYFKQMRHQHVITRNIFTHPYDCTLRITKFCGFYGTCLFILCVLIGVGYSGYYVLDLAITRDDFGHSFDINGTCLCIKSVKTSYAYEQEWRIYNLSVCDGVKDKDYTFWSQTAREWATKGDIEPCYTNSECSRVFISDTSNVYIDEAIYLYVAAVLIFLAVMICCLLSIFCLCTLPHSLGINVLHFGRKDMKDHFEEEWKLNMTAKQRFDYWISYTTRKLDVFLGSDGIYELLLKFYDDDPPEIVITDRSTQTTESMQEKTNSS